MSRLDLELVARGLARSRSAAQELISAGSVSVNGRPALKSSERVRGSDALVVSAASAYVSRAATKLLGALEDLALTVSGRALDAGASTGGFTQVLLERGCAEVTAVDVGHGQLDERLRGDTRVRVWERTNLRDLDLRHVDCRPVDLVVADVSFISLVLLMQPLTSVLRTDGRLLLMVKPQFEVGRSLLGKGGVVRSAELHQSAVAQVVAAATATGWRPVRLTRSRLPGPAGNNEYFVLFEHEAADPPMDVEQAMAAAYALPGEPAT